MRVLTGKAKRGFVCDIAFCRYCKVGHFYPNIWCVAWHGERCVNPFFPSCYLSLSCVFVLWFFYLPVLRTMTCVAYQAESKFVHVAGCEAPCIGRIWVFEKCGLAAWRVCIISNMLSNHQPTKIRRALGTPT